MGQKLNQATGCRWKCPHADRASSILGVLFLTAKLVCLSFRIPLFSILFPGKPKGNQSTILGFNLKNTNPNGWLRRLAANSTICPKPEIRDPQVKDLYPQVSPILRLACSPEHPRAPRHEARECDCCEAGFGVASIWVWFLWLIPVLGRGLKGNQKENHRFGGFPQKRNKQKTLRKTH